MAEVQIEESWKKQLLQEFEKPYFEQLITQLKNDLATGKTIYPKGSDIFKAFTYTPFDDVKVIILGQDPYHNPGQAHGLSFSVNEGVAPPPSLVNIYKELQQDLGLPIPKTGNLSPWAKQGVLLLNASLTVVANQPMSHSKIGWHIFTDEVIRQLSQKKEHLIFILWGKFAQSKKALINPTKHLILESAHPSPLSAYNGFWGCKHFSQTNDFLLKHNMTPINWAL